MSRLNEFVRFVRQSARDLIERPLLLPRFSHEIQKFRERSPSLRLSMDEIERLRAIGYEEAREKGWPEDFIRHHLGKPGEPWVGEYRPPYERMRHAHPTSMRENGRSEQEIQEWLAEFDAMYSGRETFEPSPRRGDITYNPGGSGERQTF